MTGPVTTFASSLPRASHEEILAELQKLGEDTPHELVPTWPLCDPAVRQAVTGMLGPGAVADGCRHVHANSSVEAGPWHVDDYCGQPWPPGRWAILCYFPQDTPVELGPTAARVDGRVVLAGGPAGSCLLMAQDVEHRATANTTGRARFMLKYLFRGAP